MGKSKNAFIFKCMLLIKALDFNFGNGDILVNYEDGIVSVVF